MFLVLRLTEPPAALDMAKKRAKALKEILSTEDVAGSCFACPAK